MSDFERSITIPASMLNPTPAELARESEMLSAAAKLGHQVRLSARKIARDCGMTTLPGCVMHVFGVRLEAPAEDLSVLLPGEEP